MSERLVDERVLIWAAARDAELTRHFLEQDGLIASTAGDCSELCRELDRGAGALVLADELLADPATLMLQERLTLQPAWSDLPVIMVVRAESRESSIKRILEAYGGVSILHRPLSLDTLVSAVRAALRARRKQYEVRDLVSELRATEKRRNEFLAMMAHELRNPLAPIRTGLQVLQSTEAKSVLQRTRAMMERQIGHMTRLIDDLLEVSRLTRGTIELQRTLLNAEEVLTSVVEARKRIAAEKGLEIRLTLESTPLLWVHADRTRLEQVLDNVLSNAIKFTPAGGYIEVLASREGEEVVLRTRDTGVGIAKEMLSTVFDLFTQNKQTLDRSEGGLGIGLTVVKTLVDLHGGSVKAFSEGVGKGTEIIIRLPAAQARPDLPAPITERAANGSHPRRVLLIEDNRDSAEVLATYLRSRGHTVRVAHDGPSGIQTALSMRPEVIVCDIGLPGIDGYELARRIRNSEHLSECTLVAVTGYGQTLERERGRQAGFQHYLVKPADPEELARVISS